MNSLQSKIILISLLVIILQINLYAQEDETVDFNITIDKMRLPIHPSKDDKSTYHSLDDEVATIMNQTLQELRLWDIITGVYFDSSLLSQDSTISHDMIVDFKELEGYTEAIIVLGSAIFQQGVPPDRDEAYFSIGTQNSRKKSTEQENKYPKNIQTQLSVYTQYIDIETGESLGTLELEVTYTGGAAKKSKAKTMKLLREKAKQEFKRIYWFSSNVITTKNGKTGLPRGTSSGVYKDIIFELVEPDRMWTIDDEDYIMPGGSAAIATVIDTSADSSGFKILRQWRDYTGECWAVEHPFPTWAVQFNLGIPATGSYYNLGVNLHGRPIQKYDFGVGMQASQITDTYNDIDYGFGFGAFAVWRFLNTTKIDLGMIFRIDLDIPFKKDDSGQTVHAILFSIQPGITAEFLLSAKWDLVVNAGYRIAANTDMWEYSEDEENFPAYWEKNAPYVDNSGFIVSFGFKYLLF